MRNIKDYGAIGDGNALDTAAIQRAIDDGGMVYVPRGVYRTGTLYLKSNGGLHLEAGAVLRPLFFFYLIALANVKGDCLWNKKVYCNKKNFVV